MKLPELDYGEALILPFRDRHKLIIRKEVDQLFYMVHPVTLEKLAFNSSGVFILLHFLQGHSAKEVAAAFSEHHQIPADKSLEWVTAFSSFICEKNLVAQVSTEEK